MSAEERWRQLSQECSGRELGDLCGKLGLVCPIISPQMTCKALVTELSKHLQPLFNCPDEVLLLCIVLEKL